MKLILASDLSFLLKYGYNLTGISKSEMKIGHITTAYKVSRSNIEFFKKVSEIIKENGYNMEDFDIEGKTKEEIKDFFKDKNVIHIEGGNTFYLLKVMKETGFDKIVKDLINEGKVYIGTSAGSYVACPTIEVSTWNPDGKDRFDLTDFSSMDLVPFVIKVHYNDGQKDFVINNAKNCKYKVRILRDGQGIIVENDKYTFVGDGKEVLLH